MSRTAQGAQHSQAERDSQHLASLGYRQELQRTLGLFSNFAVAFSYISVTTGIFALFFLGISSGGPAFIWSWPLVAFGQLLVALTFCELSSHTRWRARSTNGASAWPAPA
jgi:amino acid transporter